MGFDILKTKEIMDKYFGEKVKFFSLLDSTIAVAKNLISNKVTEIAINLHTSTKNEIRISGISKVIFTESVQIESEKHLGLSSGWKRSHNYYKVGVNNDYENNEDIDEYMERLSQKQKYVTQRKYPKRHKKYRTNINKFFRN